MWYIFNLYFYSPLQIMGESRKQKKPVTIASMNERERRHFVEKLNSQNRQMLERLQHTVPVLSAKKFEADFEKHQKLREYLRRRHLRPISPDKHNSEARISRSGGGSTTFDVESYMSAHNASFTTLSQLDESHDNLNELDSPIKNMAEFRKNVISSKRAPNANSAGSLPRLNSGTKSS